MKVGIAKLPFDAAGMLENMTVNDSLMVRAMVVGEASPTGVVVSLDLTNLSDRRVTAMREAIARNSKLPMSAVVLHITHTHSAPREHRINHEVLTDIIICTVNEAFSRAVPAKMAFVTVNVGRDFSRNRRWDSRGDIGQFTITDNDRCVFKDGEVYVRDYVMHELAALGFDNQPSIPADSRLDGPVDEELSLLHFVDDTGASIGGIVRFAAHVDQVAFRHGNILSAEYPGYLCGMMERRMGGNFIFLNGPCGDIKPLYQGYTFQECQRVGEGLAERLLAHRPATDSYEPLRSVEFYSDKTHVRTRTDLAKNIYALVTEVFELRAKKGRGEWKKLSIKQAREQDEHLWAVDSLAYTISALRNGDAGELLRADWPCLLGAISFNKEVNYLWLQNEVFSEMTHRLREALPQLPGLQTVALCNGGEFYLPPDSAVAGGGYEPTWSIFGKGCFDAIYCAAAALGRRIADGGRLCWTSQTLAGQLSSFGVAQGDLLMVHSAIRGCGYVEGGAEAIVRALVDAVGPTGTVLFPTFTGARENHPDNPPVFDRRRTACWTGVLPETARKMHGGVRSFHPTHSCVAFGAAAADITADHYNSVTPIDSHSPIYKVAQRGGKILIIGLDLKCLTLAHHVEELLKHPDPCFARPCLCLMADGAHRELKEYYLHDWGVKAVDYELFRPFLEKRSAVKPIQFGDSAGWLLDAAKTLDAITEAYKQWKKM